MEAGVKDYACIPFGEDDNVQLYLRIDYVKQLRPDDALSKLLASYTVNHVLGNFCPLLCYAVNKLDPADYFVMASDLDRPDKGMFVLDSAEKRSLIAALLELYRRRK